VFDYIDGGAESEWTMRENARVFDDVMLRPRSAVATASVDLRTTVLGTSIDLPFLSGARRQLADVLSRGEEAAARAAGDAGTIYTLSTLSGCTVRDVKRPRADRSGISSYVIGGRDVALAGSIARNSAVDPQQSSLSTRPWPDLRERDVRNGAKSSCRARRFTMFRTSSSSWLAAAGCRVPSRWRLDELSEHRAEDGPMPYAGRRSCAGAVDGVVGRPRMDP